MAIEDFANCFANKTGADVEEVKKVGADEWRKLVDWWNSLSAPTKVVIGAIATYGGTKLAALLGVAVGDMVAGAVVLFLGGMAWASLINSAVECAGEL